MAHGEASPVELAAHLENWRVHPEEQERALADVLDRVGWVQDVIVNRTTGRIVDGHLRVALAKKREETSIPVVYVELTEEEERLVLLTIDPLSGMAGTDPEKLRALMASVRFDGPDLLQKIDEDYLAQFRISSVDAPGLASGERDGIQQMTFTLADAQVETVKAAVRSAQKKKLETSGENQNQNGNALAAICEAFLRE